MPPCALNSNFFYSSTLPQPPELGRRRDDAGRIARLSLACAGKFRALAWCLHGAFQYLAVLIHLAQLAFGVDFVPAMYQQVIHNQSASGANTEAVFYDR